MPRMQYYDDDSDLTGDEKLIGSDTPAPGGSQRPTRQYSITSLNKFVHKNKLKKDGYFLDKAEGNTNENVYELYDHIYGIGTLFPGYIIDGYITTFPMVDPQTDITILAAVQLPE